MQLEKLGTEYGGWTIDLDSVHDGDIVVDAGIGMDVSFAKELLQRRAVSLRMYDPGSAYCEYAKRELGSGAEVYCVAVSDADGMQTIFKNRHGGSDSLEFDNLNAGGGTEYVPAVSMKSVIARHRPSLVKLDIEGTEYRVWRDLLGVKQVAIEFHDRLIACKTSSETEFVIEGFISFGYDVIARTALEATFLLREKAD